MAFRQQLADKFAARLSGAAAKEVGCGNRRVEGNVFADFFRDLHSDWAGFYPEGICFRR